MGFTTDPTDPRIQRSRGTRQDYEPVPQQEVYLILSDEERAKGFVRPVRRSYKHLPCGTVTTMALPLAETYARNPSFYSATYCVGCHAHRVVAEFVWEPDGSPVGS